MAHGWIWGLVSFFLLVSFISFYSGYVFRDKKVKKRRAKKKCGTKRREKKGTPLVILVRIYIYSSYIRMNHGWNIMNIMLTYFICKLSE